MNISFVILVAVEIYRFGMADFGDCIVVVVEVVAVVVDDIN